MNCSDAKKLLTLFAGGDLEEAEFTRVNEHVASCPECGKLLASLRADRELVASLKSSGPEPPSFGEFWDGLSEKLAPEARRRLLRKYLHRAVRAATVAAVLLVAVVFLFHVGDDKKQPVESSVEEGVIWIESQTENQQPGLELEECELCVDSNREYDF